MNIPNIIVANPQYSLVVKLLEEINLVVQLQKRAAVIDCENILSCKMHHSKYANEALK